MNGDGNKAAADVAEVLKRSPVEVADQALLPPGGWLLYLTSLVADGFPKWGSDVKKRDQLLRDFITKESFFASALATIQGRNAAMRWTLKGPPRTMEVCRQILLQANFGAGWMAFISALSEDLYTQDGGAFVATIHASDSEESPVIGFHTLDAARCWPTGAPDYPVIYLDRKNVWHRLRPFEIVQVLELASSIEHPTVGPLFRLQRCALTRFLETAQRMRNQATYMKEKTGGRFEKSITFVSGVSEQKVRDALQTKQTEADAKGLTKYVDHVIIGGFDPDSPVDVKTVDFASLPDGFNEREWMNVYYVALALAFLTDVQEFAPLPGGNLGTSTQSEILHQKSRGRGPALFQNLIANLINSDILPKTIEFAWEERDLQAEKEEADAFKAKADGFKVLVDGAILTPEAVRQWMLDDGTLPQEIFDMMGSQDITPETVSDQESKPEQETTPETEVIEQEEKAGPPAERLELERSVADALAAPLARIGRAVRKRLRGSEE